MDMYKRSFKAIWNLFGLNRNSFFMAVPIFIIGHPRSGTTFIHKLFFQTNETAAFEAWRIIFLSLTARTRVKPLIRFLARRNKTTLLPKQSGHRIAMDKVEEEMFFLHFRDTHFILVGSPLGFMPDDYKSFRFHDHQPRPVWVRSVKFLKGCFQWQIYATKRTQIVAQTHFSTHRIKTLLEVFPEAKSIYMHRLPDQTLPSCFSLNYYFLNTLCKSSTAADLSAISSI
jgi:omega-hydroxy-beta-dihydromenaquinone-9 sulfotransferase